LADIANDGFVCVYRDVLNGDLLLSGPAMAVETLSQYRDRALRLVSHLQVPAPRAAPSPKMASAT
jgi:hypothetical protein